ncbi:MAG: methyltransferase domain-containing protein [Candidatus Omnitrophica bacterium]|nr:methyltransferase domain-containing protein [Candidatus Omnitrophota bacterium]
MKKASGLSPELYDKNYYLNSLPGIEYLNHLDLDPALRGTIKFGKISSGQRILDFGCGRGQLAIALAKKGCEVLATDFSQDAINFAREYVKQFPNEIENRVEFKRMTIQDLDFEAEFDAIIFNQVYEHLHDWELEILIAKFKRALKSNGCLVISTPNLNYIRYLFPLKRLLEFPFKTMKEISRLLRGRSRHASSFKAFLKEIFKIQYPKSEHTQLHINLQTPGSIRTFLERQGFRVRLECVDYHKNLLSLTTRKWWGETIWVSCQPD